MEQAQKLTASKLREIERFRNKNNIGAQEELIANNEYALRRMLQDHYNSLEIQKEEIRNKQKLIRAIERQIEVIERRLKVFGKKVR